MTNQEVAKSLKNIRDLYPWGEDSYKTLDYAIRAVVELPKRRKEAKRWRAKTHQMPCDDAIIRQAVLDAIHEADMNAYDERSLVRDLTQTVNELPSVNLQEPLTEEDYIELRDRFGEYVEFVVRDMISGKGERWKETNNDKRRKD